MGNGYIFAGLLWGALGRPGELWGALGKLRRALGNSGELWGSSGELWRALGKLWAALASSGKLPLQGGCGKHEKSAGKSDFNTAVVR